MGVIFSLLVLPSAFGFTHHAIGDWWEDLTNQIDEELERSRIGRELNRIIEDVGKVAEIASDFSNLASIVTSGITPIGIVNLAVQYGHNPDQLFGRFQERVQSLQSRHGEQLSNTEMAAALQSVLEEPALPEGVYMGGSCIIDLTGCPEEIQTPSRGNYYQFSCYLEGLVSKKKVNNVNRASCTANWLDAGRGSSVEIKFLADTQYATYAWERCARVILEHDEQRQFLTSRSTNCNQPIARHDIGDVCVVDYASCSYGANAQRNVNRVGNIVEGPITLSDGSRRRVYACAVSHGPFALNPAWRDACATVHVGDIEVNEFLVAHPEPSQQLALPVQQQQQVQQVPQLGRPQNQSPITSSGLTRDFVRLGDIPNFLDQVQVTAVYGQEGIVEIAPPSVQSRKAEVQQKLQHLGAYKEFNIDEIKENVEGQVLPGPLQTFFGDERIKIIIHQNYDDDLDYCIAITKGVISEFSSCSPGFTPTIKMETSQSVLESVESESDLLDAFDTGKITYNAVGLGKKIKFGISYIAFKLFT